MGFDYLNALTKRTKCLNNTKSQEKRIWYTQETRQQEKLSQASCDFDRKVMKKLE